MPDGRNLRCFRVTIECASGRVLHPIISAPSSQEAREKAAVLAAELCRVTLPWSPGGKAQRANDTEPAVTDARRIHRWWSE